MKLKNYAIVRKSNLINNIKDFKNNYNYSNYILNVSNNAFCHGMRIIKYISDEFEYFYTINFSDVVEIRKYNHKVKIIYDGPIHEDNIFDLILNDAIIVIKSKELFDYILKLKIKDKFEMIFKIDKFDGISSKIEITDMIQDIKDMVHINILGVIAEVNENNYMDFKYIVEPLKKMQLVILNNELDKNKIKMSNAIILDNSIYGIDTSKKKLFVKNTFNLSSILEVYSTIIKIVKIKNEYIGLIPMGLLHGLNTNKVFINDKYYNIKDIKNNYTLINIDENIKVNDQVEIMGSNLPSHSILELSLLTSNLQIDYKN